MKTFMKTVFRCHDEKRFSSVYLSLAIANHSQPAAVAVAVVVMMLPLLLLWSGRWSVQPERCTGSFDAGHMHWKLRRWPYKKRVH